MTGFCSKAGAETPLPASLKESMRSQSYARTALRLFQNSKKTVAETHDGKENPVNNNIIIVLGVLTFALQLCLVLFFMLRCWRLDSRLQEALKHPETGNKLTAPSCFQQDVHKQASYRAAAAASPVLSAAAEEYEPITNSLLAPPIPWDLVQR
ncbi:hypothetical protein EYF80_033791 [Liparis tanakae]|uniref:Uncharacterized protein n=1 Tax=Liparis tanakae TaxID=230148 RepID=A0A4Z2GRA8_9TELE|nr:hypothetical protein EYF80_033791 [Liparis tanakae]